MSMTGGRSDEELLSSFLRGDESSFGELMGRHEQKVFAVALKITGSRADAIPATNRTAAYSASSRPAGSWPSRSASWVLISATI